MGWSRQKKIRKKNSQPTKMHFKEKCYIQIVTNIIYFMKRFFDLGKIEPSEFFYMIFLLFFEENGLLLSMEKWWNFTNPQYFVLCRLFLDSLQCDQEKPSDSYPKSILKKGLVLSFCHYNVYGTLNLVLGHPRFSRWSYKISLVGWFVG